ncbi:MAG: hypothetical protein QOH90_1815 [Actinomycetota bacterium]|nr:hypothetical protein [Actinomycetota bacterium]
MTPFAPPAPPTPDFGSTGERPKARVSPLLTGEDPTQVASGVERGAFKTTDAGIVWVCRACETENPIDAYQCAACGTPFRETLREPEQKGPQRDPGKTALFSLFFPGAGHAYLGQWGQAIARGVISVWVVFTALMGAVQKNGGLAIAIVFGLAATGLWIASAHDAYRDAEGNHSLVLLKGKVFLYVVMGLLLLLIMLLIGAGFQARNLGA